MNKVKVGDKVLYRDGEVAPVTELFDDGGFCVRTKKHGHCREYLKSDDGDVELYWSSPEPARIATAAEMASIHRNILPTDAAARNAIPLADGCLDYFPNALCKVAALSKVANEQHNPGEPMHWAREKSTDHRNKIMKHLVDAGGIDSDGQLHSAKVAWRALALLEDELIAAGAVPGRNAKGAPGVLSKPQHNCIEDET